MGRRDGAGRFRTELTKRRCGPLRRRAAPRPTHPPTSRPIDRLSGMQRSSGESLRRSGQSELTCSCWVASAGTWGSLLPTSPSRLTEGTLVAPDGLARFGWSARRDSSCGGVARLAGVGTRRGESRAQWLEPSRDAPSRRRYPVQQLRITGVSHEQRQVAEGPSTRTAR